MSENVVVQLDCPHCDYRSFQSISLRKPRDTADCPACGSVFGVDPEIDAMSRLLGAARAARREREQRRSEMRAQAAAPQRTPLSEVLKQLDRLLVRLENEARRA